MTDSGKATKSAMLGVIKDIGDYIAIVQKELEMIRQDAENLSGSWDDDQFGNFLDCVRYTEASLSRELDDLADVRHELQRKVGLM